MCCANPRPALFARAVCDAAVHRPHAVRQHRLLPADGGPADGVSLLSCRLGCGSWLLCQPTAAVLLAFAGPFSAVIRLFVRCCCGLLVLLPPPPHSHQHRIHCHAAAAPRLKRLWSSSRDASQRMPWWRRCGAFVPAGWLDRGCSGWQHAHGWHMALQSPIATACVSRIYLLVPADHGPGVLGCQLPQQGRRVHRGCPVGGRGAGGDAFGLGTQQLQERSGLGRSLCSCLWCAGSVSPIHLASAPPPWAGQAAGRAACGG